MLKRLVIFSLIALMYVSIPNAYAAMPSNKEIEGITAIRAMNENREIRISCALRVGDVERVYYIASDKGTDVFCILSKQVDGLWDYDAQTSGILPKDSTDTPHIAFDNAERVYITYTPGKSWDTSVFTYAVTLVVEKGVWYVESVDFGKLHSDSLIFNATIVNLATGITSEYSFDTITEQVLSSTEKANTLDKIKVDDFCLAVFVERIANAHQQTRRCAASGRVLHPGLHPDELLLRAPP